MYTKVRCEIVLSLSVFTLSIVMVPSYFFVVVFHLVFISLLSDKRLKLLVPSKLGTK